MDLDSVTEGSRPVFLEKRATGAATMPKFDPVLLELGEEGEDGERLVFYKYRSRIQRFFEKKGISPDEAQDLTQETFLRVFRGKARLENREQLEAWIFEIARNVRSNALRAKGTLKRAATVISLDESGPKGESRDVANPAPLSDEPNALASAITREQLRAFQGALAELPDQMRQCVCLRLQGDFKYKEIAQIMRISIETVKSHLHHAKKRLRSMLEPHFGPIDF